MFASRRNVCAALGCCCTEQCFLFIYSDHVVSTVCQCESSNSCNCCDHMSLFLWCLACLYSLPPAVGPNTHILAKHTWKHRHIWPHWSVAGCAWMVLFWKLFQLQTTAIIIIATLATFVGLQVCHTHTHSSEYHRSTAAAAPSTPINTVVYFLFFFFPFWRPLSRAKTEQQRQHSAELIASMCLGVREMDSFFPAHSLHLG